MIFHPNNAYEVLPEVISCGIKKFRTIIEIYFHLGMHNELDNLMLPMMSKKQEKTKKTFVKKRVFTVKQRCKIKAIHKI